jgi:hypothetical protein
MLNLAALALLTVTAYDQGAFTRSLSGGVEVSLIAVSNVVKRRSWSPTGQQLSEYVYRTEAFPEMAPRPRRELALVFILPRTKNGSPAVRVDYPDGSGQTLMMRPEDPYRHVYQRIWADDERAAEPRVGIAMGPWKTVHSQPLKGKATGDPRFKISFTAAGTNKSGVEFTRIRMDSPRGMRAGQTGYQLVVVSPDGRDLDSEQLSPYQKGPSEYVFSQSDGRKLGSIEIRACPYSWVTFRNVRLQPEVLRR